MDRKVSEQKVKIPSKKVLIKIWAFHSFWVPTSPPVFVRSRYERYFKIFKLFRKYWKPNISENSIFVPKGGGAYHRIIQLSYY